MGVKQRMVRVYETAEAFVAGEGRFVRDLDARESFAMRLRPVWRLEPDGSRLLGRRVLGLRAMMLLCAVIGLLFAVPSGWAGFVGLNPMNWVGMAVGLVFVGGGVLSLLTGPGTLAKLVPLRVRPSGSLELCTLGVTVGPGDVLGVELVEVEVLYTNTKRRERKVQGHLVVRLPGTGAPRMARVLMWEAWGKELPEWSAALAAETAAMFGLEVEVRKDPEELRLVESTGD